MSPTWLITIVVAAAACGLFLFVRRRWYRLEDAPTRADYVSPEMAMGLFLGYLLLPWLGAYAVTRWFWPDMPLEGPPTLERMAKLALGGYAAQSIVIVAFAILLRRSKKTRGRLMRISAALRWGFRGAGALALFWPFAAVTAFLVESIMNAAGADTSDPVAHETLRLLQRQPIDLWWITLAVVVVIIAPIVEETIYRGVLQHSLVKLKVRRWPAILITSGIFAAMHLHIAELHAVAALFVLSMGFGWVFEKTGRLTAPIVMHILFNAGNLALASLIAPPPV